MEVTITTAIITQIYEGSIGIKKKATDDTRQMIAAQVKALDFEPAHCVNLGDTPPKIIQVTSPKVINTV